jgi:hypothetical protein
MSWGPAFAGALTGNKVDAVVVRIFMAIMGLVWDFDLPSQCFWGADLILPGIPP